MRSKYSARPSVYDGYRFASISEKLRYIMLKDYLRQGLIANLELQPKYELVKAFATHSGEKIRALSYIADFRYLDKQTNRIIVEDVKGMKTEVYRIKRKLLLWKYPDINFVEITA